MTKKFISKIVVLTIFISAFGVMHFVNAQDLDSAETSTSVSNALPVLTVTPSDGGSHSGAGTGSTDGNPTNVGDNVTFTATAFDVNTDQYYLAVCKTDAVSAGDNVAPTCTGGAWAVSAATNSTVGASVTYTTLQGDAESNAWYAFVCDKVSGTGGCFPANAAGDQGSATGTITFADVPADEETVTIDSVVYVFDTDGDGIVAAGTEVDTAASEDGAEAAAALVAVEAGASSSMTARGNIVYVFADTAGTAGNAIGMAETCAANCTVSVSTLTGGDLENASPFHVNHKPTLGAMSYGDTAGAAGLNHATGTVEPGDTVYISAVVSDSDTNAAQDTVSMYVCADGGTFTSGATPGCDTTTLCSVTGVNPTTDYAECSFSNLTTVPTAHDTYNVEVFIVDNHGVVATEASAHSFDVEDVAPVVGTYTATDAPAPSAGGSDTVDFSVTLTDNNGDNDVDSVNGVFFYESGGVDGNDTVATHDCSASENNCYIHTACTLSLVSSPTAAGTKTSMGLDSGLTASCQVTVYSNASDGNWDVQMEAVDSDYNGGTPTEFADAGVELTVEVLQGIDIQEGSIAYSTVSIGGTSAEQTTRMGNVGNSVIDVLLDGTDMTDGGTQSIPAAQQKFSYSTGFDWDAAGYALLNASGTGVEGDGCLDVDMAVRTDHTSPAGDTPLYWKIRIPATQAAGSYTGSNTFTSTTDFGVICAD